jgi:hypothetical protein
LLLPLLVLLPKFLSWMALLLDFIVASSFVDRVVSVSAGQVQSSRVSRRGRAQNLPVCAV